MLIGDVGIAAKQYNLIICYCIIFSARLIFRYAKKSKYKHSPRREDKKQQNIAFAVESLIGTITYMIIFARRS